MNRTRAILPALSAVIVGLFATGLLACGDDKVKRSNKRGFQGGMQPPMSANLKDVGQPSADLVAKKKRPPRTSGKKGFRIPRNLAIPKGEDFSEQDFVESPQNARDPFRNYLIESQIQTSEGDFPTVGTDVVYLKDYTLGQLKVTGIVGARRKVAMILDPRSGRTTILKRRDRIGKEAALIFQVNRDHLVVLVPRKKPGAKPELRKIYVDDTRKLMDIGSDELRPDEGGIRRYRARLSRKKKEQ